jgi:hypothetical protein
MNDDARTHARTKGSRFVSCQTTNHTSSDACARYDADRGFSGDGAPYSKRRTMVNN